jgi:hypothetical protein
MLLPNESFEDRVWSCEYTVDLCANEVKLFCILCVRAQATNPYL